MNSVRSYSRIVVIFLLTVLFKPIGGNIWLDQEIDILLQSDILQGIIRRSIGFRELEDKVDSLTKLISGVHVDDPSFSRRHLSRPRNGRRGARKRGHNNNNDYNEEDLNYPDNVNSNTNANTNELKQTVETSNINYNAVPSSGGGITKDQLGEIIRGIIGRGKTTSSSYYDM